ncbi:MAG: 50S ribosomal protein L35 [Candidatus Omnitrophota bacterium]|nr:50S ribosomal protein L35 [Candidatus Omnitrophota bacterium]
MPKLKTNKAVKKRFKITATGKVKSARSLRRHMLADRSPKKKRQSRGMHLVHHTDVRRIKTLLPYGT